MDDPVRVDVICEDEMTTIRTFICESGDVESLRSDLRAIGAAPMYMCVTPLDHASARIYGDAIEMKPSVQKGCNT